MRSWSRVAGACYLLVIAGGLFAQVAVRGTLIVPGDPVATVAAIGGNEQLWRWGLLVHLLYLLPAIAVNVIVPDLLVAGGATLARLARSFGLTSVAVEAAGLIWLAGPLVIAGEGPALGAVAEPARQAAAYLAVRMFPTAFGLALALFAGFCAVVGVLVLRSRAVPRAIGVLMVAAGGCYLVLTGCSVLAPVRTAVLQQALLLPCLVAELSLAVWLLLRGVAGAGASERRIGADRARIGA
jgi:Domain of unknown function (DUF4386)